MRRIWRIQRSERLARWRVDPRPVFVTDGLGAVASALLLGLVRPFASAVPGTTGEALRTLAASPRNCAALDVAWVLAGPLTSPRCQ